MFTFYGSIIAYFMLKSKAKAKAALIATPKPADKPDYHTVVVRSSIPAFGTPEWESYANESQANVEAWIASVEAEAV